MKPGSRTKYSWMKNTIPHIDSNENLHLKVHLRYIRVHWSFRRQFQGGLIVFWVLFLSASSRSRLLKSTSLRIHKKHTWGIDLTNSTTVPSCSPTGPSNWHPVPSLAHILEDGVQLWVRLLRTNPLSYVLCDFGQLAKASQVLVSSSMKWRWL